MGPRSAALLTALAILSPVLTVGVLIWSLLGLLLNGSPRALSLFFMAAAGSAMAALAASSVDSSWRNMSWNSRAAWGARVLGAGGCTTRRASCPIPTPNARPQTSLWWPSPHQAS